MFKWLWNAIGQRYKDSVGDNDSADDFTNESQSPAAPVGIDPDDTLTDTSNDVASQRGYTNDDNSTKEVKAESVLFYCPYRDCSYSTVILPSLCNHIRERHDDEFSTELSDFQILNRLRLVSSGALISLQDPNAALDPGERISNKEHFYCPYEECSEFAKRRSDLKLHIRSEHYDDLKLHSKLYCTPNNAIVTFLIQDRSRLPRGEILIPCDANGKVAKKYQKFLKNPVVNGEEKSTSLSKPLKRQSTPTGPRDNGINRRSNPKRRKRNPLKGDEWELY